MPFAGIEGQDICLEVLKRSLRTGKTAHAYLFHGIEGCGKRLTALAFMEAIFCNRDEGCGRCPSCLKMAALHHPDLHIIEPDGAFIKIDQIRELQRELALRPYEAPKKGCIIDGADRLHPAAANALLKTLEEPPGEAVLILIAENLAAVMPTILSRCQQLRFAPMTPKTIEALLIKGGAEAESAKVSAALSAGSMKKALAVEGSEAITLRTELMGMLQTLNLNDAITLFRRAEEFAKDKDKVPEILEILRSIMRDILLIQGGGGEIANSDLAPLLEQQASRLPMDRVMEGLEHIALAREALLRNVNPKLTLEVLFMRLAT